MYKLVLLLTLLMGTLATQAQMQNALSPQEKKQGWELLFNGKDVSGWHTYGGKGVGTAWKVEGDALKLDVPTRAGNKAPNGGDIVSNVLVSGDFELKADWKVSPLANSGIFFFVKEAEQYNLRRCCRKQTPCGRFLWCRQRTSSRNQPRWGVESSACGVSEK